MSNWLKPRLALLRQWPLAVALAIVAHAAVPLAATAQEVAEAAAQEVEGFGFEVEKSVACTPVKSQDRTGTCWSFATASFLESEMMRKGHSPLNLSEMFVARNVYLNKAQNYVLRQGKANFGEGALAHDLINAVRSHGLMPESAYPGNRNGQGQHDHSEMAAVLESVLKAITARSRPSTEWKQAYSAILDVYLGQAPEKFSFEGQDYTPQEFAEHLGFNAKDYVNLTSYTHHPFGEPFVLEIPDNFSNGSFQNVPIDQLVQTIDNAIANGYSVAWDGDVSESGFNSGRGLAVLPKNPNDRKRFSEPVEQMQVTQEMRQQTFEDLTTSDDHLMHLTGIARDKEGNKYYIIKNSWGEIGPYDGYLYMSEAYVRLKTVAILVHKDALEPSVTETGTAAPSGDGAGSR